MPLLGLPRFRVVLEHYTGWPELEWTLELDEAHALRVVAGDRPLRASSVA